jgi:putative FmdB family regulatory protein
MPLYEYECRQCGGRFERRQSVHDEPVSECPECGSAVRRVLFPVGIIFKGSGWYVTDSRSPNPAGANGNGNGNGAKSKEESASSEAKPASSDSKASTENKASTESKATAGAKT